MTATATNSFAVFTVCNIAYLPKALVLADSLFARCGQRLHVVIFDRKREMDAAYATIEPIWVEDLGVPHVFELAFIYDIIEFSTSLKAFVALQLLEKFEKVVFMDADTCLYGALDPILEDLENQPILLTPHYTTPQPSTDHESDLGMMRFGSFNLGFFAVKRNEETGRFLNWWNRRCLDFSFMESQFGLSVDQKWISIAPCLFKSVGVSFNLGYNVAPWNTFERTLSKTTNGAYLVNGKYPLVFFHFSNFDHADTQYLNKRASCELGLEYETLKEIADEYSAKLISKHKEVKSIPYSFDYMSDGSYISPTLRRAYAAVRYELPAGHDPFDSSGPVGAFAQKNHLVLRGVERYSYPSLKESERFSRLFSVIYALLRFVLILIGPMRFYDLSKLMVYLSIYRKNRRLWKT